MPDYDVTVAATFKIRTTQPDMYIISVGAFAGGNIATSASIAEAGETVTLTATPNTDYELETISVHKTGDVTTTVILYGTDNSRTFTMPDYDVTVVATFKATTTVQPATYTVAFFVAGGEGSLEASVDGAAIATADQIEEGKTVVFTATPAANYKVKEWRLNDILLSNIADNTFTLVNLTTNSEVVVTFDRLTGNPELEPATPLRAWIRNRLLHVEGLSAGEVWSVYSVSGALVYRNIATGEEADIPLHAQGTYIVNTGGRTIRVVYE